MHLTGKWSCWAMLVAAVVSLSRAEYQCSGEADCPIMSDPVCGMDDKTYKNECEAKCYNDVAIKYNGECKRRTCVTECVNKNRGGPMCGKDGFTYINQCYMECNEIKLEHRGACKQPKKCECDKRDRSEEREVCGMDGKTHRFCDINCKESKTGVAYDKPCVTSCYECPKIVRPVCGTDGMNYDNACRAHCKGIKVAFANVCLVSNPISVYVPDFRVAKAFVRETALHRCENKFKPVCGNLEVVYFNACVALMNGDKMAHPGICRSACGCGNEPIEETCTKSGNMYPNKCTALCNNEEPVAKGECNSKSA